MLDTDTGGAACVTGNEASVAPTPEPDSPRADRTTPLLYRQAMPR